MSDRLNGRLLAIACVGLVADLVVQPLRAIRDLADTDFVNFVAASRILRGGGCLYCTATQQAVSHSLVGGLATDRFVVFVSPPVVAATFTPLSTIDPHVALALFVVVSVLAIAVAGWLIATRWLSELSGQRRLVLVAATAASAPAAWGIALGQLDPLLFCTVVVGITLCRRHPVAGGLLISVLAVKPQLFLLVPVALIVGRNWRSAVGAGLGLGGLLVSTLVLMGWNHALDWPRFVLSQYDNVASHSISIPLNIATLFGSSALTVAVSLGLLAAGAVILWQCRALLSDAETAVAFGLTLTLVASPHLLAYDALFLAIPLVWMARRDWGRAVTLALAQSAAYVVDSLAFPTTAVLQPLVILAIAIVVIGHGRHLHRTRRAALFVGPGLRRSAVDAASP